MAIFSDTALVEIETRNDPKARTLKSEGLRAADMVAPQRAQLRRLLDHYAGRLSAAARAHALRDMEDGGFGELRFAWAGGTEVGQAHYYRIHGPTILIEYDNQQTNANHIHTVWRDLRHDFGGDLLADHYRKHKHATPTPLSQCRTRSPAAAAHRPPRSRAAPARRPPPSRSSRSRRRSPLSRRARPSHARPTASPPNGSRASIGSCSSTSTRIASAAPSRSCCATDRSPTRRASGWIDRESRRPMTADAMFRIASQSKAITSTAILMLVEEGKIALGDPVSRFIPAYARTTVASRADSGRTIVPARRQITIQDLLTHTAGISYGGERWIADQYAAKGLGPAAGNGWYTADKTEPVCETMERLATLPFIAQPGEAYVYGYNTDILGCVVERASGLSLDEFIRTRITGPLGMTDTYFFVPPAKASRLVDAVHERQHGTRRASARRLARPGPLRRGTAAELLGRGRASSRRRATMRASCR